MGDVHCVVVGGGISGLAAAYRLSVLRPDATVTVLEAAPTIGGPLRLAEVAGAPVDVGADSLLNRRPEAVDLVRAVGLGDDLCHPANRQASVWSRGALRPLPPTVLGVPTDLAALVRSRTVSPRGVLRAGLDRLLPGAPPSEDVAVGRWLSGRLGREVADRLLEPLLGGIYAGHADLLSLQAATPQLAALAADGRSVLAAARRACAERATVGDVPVLAGVAGGVGRLPRAVAAASGADVRTSSTVRELRRMGVGWRLVIGRADRPVAVEADTVLLATPAVPTARLLADEVPSAAAQLRRVEAASVAVVTLAVAADRVGGALWGSGFLVPPVEGRAVKAATWSTRKWAWLGERAGAGTVLMRASFGRHGETAVLQHDDADLVELAVRELGDAVGLHGPVLDARVTRWGGALPQYAVGHRELVARVRSAVEPVVGLDVCGATYDGVGVAACVADARAAADRLVAGLTPRATMQP